MGVVTGQTGGESRYWGKAGGPVYLPRLGALLAQFSHEPSGSCKQIPSASPHHYPRSALLAKSAPGAAVAAEEKKGHGDFSFPWEFYLPPSSHLLDVPGYLLSSSSILSDVKEDSTGSSLTRHPGL